MKFSYSAPTGKASDSTAGNDTIWKMRRKDRTNTGKRPASRSVDRKTTGKENQDSKKRNKHDAGFLLSHQ
jgi:hypothetical protein